jgi:hypothetical protein
LLLDGFGVRAINLILTIWGYFTQTVSQIRGNFVMKSRLMRLGLSLTLGLLLIVAVLLWGQKQPDPVAAFSPPNVGQAMPQAAFHLWDINEIFSCAGGSVQFIEFVNPLPLNGQHLLAGHILTATNLAGTQIHTFTFLSNLSSITTANKSFLMATTAFTGLVGSVIPDYTLPDNFLFTEGGSLNFAGVDTFNYSAGQLPGGGLFSLNRNGTWGVNSPKNFADQQGSISCSGASVSFVYLPLIVKDFIIVSEHAADLPLDLF